MPHDSRLYRLGPRVPVFNVGAPVGGYLGNEAEDLLDAPTAMEMPSNRVIGARAPSTTKPENSATCTAGSADLCEKPASSATMTLPIVLGVAIPVIGALVLLVYLHRRNVRRQRQEDASDPHKSLDFGMGEGGNKKRKSGFLLGVKNEKDAKHRAQLSMDMNMSSPYLLPPGLQSSRDSLHSLARSLKKDEDPYGPINEYAQSDVASLRSQRPGPQRKNTDGMSIYTTGSSGRDSSKTGRFVPPPRQNSLPQSVNSVPSSPLANNPYTQSNPFDSHNALPETNVPMPVVPTPALQAHQSLRAELDTVDPQIQTAAYLEETAGGHSGSVPNAAPIQEPPAVATKSSQQPFPRSPSRADRVEDELHMSMTSNPDTSHYIEDDDPSYLASIVQAKEPAPQRQSPQGLGLLDPPVNNGTGSEVSQSPGFNFQDDFDMGNPYSEEELPARGRQPHRNSNLMGENGGLGVPQRETKRLSVGYRPLPPTDVMETEDPERRADRIRSFYKEYFDDSKRESVVPPLPTKAPGRAQQQHKSQQAEYYEDYDGDYLGETAFFDPDSNAFVMPYAQPVTRRAMTPPPRGRVPGGPGHGPRPHGGSMGGIRGPGMRGPPGARPRAGSAMSNRIRGPPSIPGSVPGSRAGSRPGSRARKPMPPPSTLNTLPNPSKLKDDSFALLGSIEFAPPDTFADRAAGRSQSPAGERKPYQLKVPVVSPLVSTYDEMAALPSPHLLRKSGTFTALDFAPPKRFKDSETMSDAGSIRSNRSGLSAMHTAALRSGAGRVSRLPGDTVFSQAEMTDQLKPQWGMRP